MNPLLDPNYQRGNILPIVKDTRTGERSLGAPQFVVDLLSALMLPGDVYKGNVLLRDPETGNISDEVIKRSADLAGAVTLGAGAIPADKNSLRMGIKAYHGSPHDFDKFDLSKIGTGEGAQAYGHGLYFADREGVARGYRDALRHKADPRDAINDIITQFTELRVASPTKENIKRFVKDNSALSKYADDDRIMDRLYNVINETDVDEKYYQFKEMDMLLPEPSIGRMYEVNIDADPADFLDYDAPFEAQPPAVQKHFAYLAKRGAGPDGSDLARRIESQVFLDEAREAGIPGIKYLDAGSRDGSGNSRNYVVFDDKLISIVKKYGIGALVLAGVISQEQGDALAAEGYPQ